jgi:hypothetical protein
MSVANSVYKKIRANSVLAGTGSGNEISTTSGNLILNSASSGDVRVTYDLPTNDRSLATKIYVDSVAAGLSAKDAVRVKAANLASVVTYSGSGLGKTITRNANGAISGDAATYFDGVSLVLNDRVLIAAETDGKHNGIYYVSNAGSAGAPWVLTRSTDADNSGTITAEVKTGMFTFVTAGSVNQSSGWILITQGTITLDTTVLVFTQFSGAGAFSISNVGTGAGIYKDLTGSQFNLRSLRATFTAGSTGLFTATQNTDDVTYNFDQSKLTGTGTLASGSINYTSSSTITTGGPVTLNNQDISTANKFTINSVTAGTYMLLDGKTNRYYGSISNQVMGATGLLDFYDANGTIYYLKMDNSTSTLTLANKINHEGATTSTIIGNSTTAYRVTDGTNVQYTIDTSTGSQRFILNNNNLAFGGDGVVNIASSSSTAFKIKSATKDFITIDTNTSDPTGDLVIFKQGRLTMGSTSNDINKVFIPDNLAKSFAINRNEAADILTFNTTTSNVAIETGTDTSLNLGGGLKRFHRATITSTSTLGKFDDVVPVDATSGNIDITLPSANTEKGRIYSIFKSDSGANTVTIKVASGQYIMDVIDDTIVLRNQFDVVKVIAVSDGTKHSWVIV